MAKSLIVIGLGGTGCFIARDFEEKVKYLKGIEDLPNHISVHYYDSEIEPPTGVSNDRYTIAVSDRSSAVKTCEKFRRELPNFKKSWSLENSEHPCPEILGFFTGEGLGQLRAKGRLGLLKHLQNERPTIFDEIKKSIDDKVEALKEQKGQLNIFMVGSVAGGTGSGTFLDLAFLLKDHLGDYANKIVGIFLVGHAAMKGRTVDRESRIWANANTYAAAMELNYWLREREPFTMTYPTNIDLSTNRLPFDLCCIIDDYNIGGNVLKTHREYEKLVADSILDIYVREGGGFEGVDNGFGMIGNLDDGFSKSFGSFGRGTIRYPIKDNLAYLGTKLFSICIDNIIVTSETQSIMTYLNESIRNLQFRDDPPTKDGSRNDDIKKNLDSGRVINGFGEEKGVPAFPPVKAYIDQIKKRNCYDMIDKTNERIKEQKVDLDNFLKERKKAIIEEKSNSLYHILFKGREGSQSLLKEKGLSFVHEYITNLENYIKVKRDIANKFLVEKLDEKIRLIGDEKNEIETRLKTNQSKKNKNIYLEQLKKEFEICKEYKIWEQKIEIYKSVLAKLKQFHDGIDAVRHMLKKDILDEMKQEYQRYPGGKTLYPESSLTLEVLSIRKKQEYFDDIFDHIVGTTEERINNFLIEQESEFMRRVLLPLMGLSEARQEDILIKENEQIQVIDRYQKDIPLTGNEKKALIKNLKRAGRIFFEDIFKDKIPGNIWIALYDESKMKENSFTQTISNYLTKIEKEAARPFWRGAQPTNTQKFLSADVSSYVEFKSSHPGEIPERNKIWKESWPEEREKLPLDEINITVLEIGSSLRHLNNFRTDGKYYEDYQEYSDKNWLFLDHRYNQNTIPELVLTEINGEILFLLCEHFEIIKETIDKKGSLTGIFKFKNNVLDNKLKGRQNTINWFSKKTDNRMDILTELQEVWKSIPPNERKNEFDKMKKKLDKQYTNRKISQNVREIYNNNAKLVEKSIKRTMYEPQRIVPQSLLA